MAMAMRMPMGKGKEMEYLRENMRKLGLWYTRTFKPIMTHDELDPVMATLGFVGLPPYFIECGGGGGWKEYAHSAGGSGLWSSNSSLTPPPTENHQTPPRPRLPYPRIDGLHILTYTAFLDAVNFYLQMPNISDLFHIRGIPLNRLYDCNMRWIRMEEDEDSVFVYREGTLDQTVHAFSPRNKNDINGGGGKGCNSMVVRVKGSITPIGCIVALKDIIV